MGLGDADGSDEQQQDASTENSARGSTSFAVDNVDSSGGSDDNDDLDSSCNEQQQDDALQIECQQEEDDDDVTEEESTFRKRRTMSTPCLKSTAAVNPKEYGRRHSSAFSFESCVHFGTIQIREYGRTISDDSSVSEGPPIGLSWSYQSTSEYKVDDYENQHPPRRCKEEFLIPPQVQEHMLLSEWQHAVRDVRDSTMESKRVRQQREESMHTPRVTEVTQELFQSSKRKLMRLKHGTSSKKEMRDLWQSARDGQIAAGCD